MDFSQQHVLVVGAGISGIGAARALAKQGAKVTLSDLVSLSAERTAALSGLGIECVFGTQKVSLLAGVDSVVLSPGIARTVPLVAAAERDGIPVIAELELAYRLAAAPFYAITGTNGKTTTTTLLGDMIAAAGLPHLVGGNIGSALSEQADTLQEDGVIVAEVSSFQLESIVDFRPHAAVILNITPDHFERHGDMAGYVRAKARIFENQEAGDMLILNAHDPYAADMARQARATTWWLDTEGPTERGAYIEDGVMYLRKDEAPVRLVALDELQLRGSHNWVNMLAAALLAWEAGVPLRVIRGVLRVFSGLEHRVEYVTTKNGIAYYNDSKATNTDATVKAVAGFAAPPVLITGGYDKGTDLTDLAQAMAACRGVVLFGASAERFATAAQAAGATGIVRAESMTEAVREATRLAQEHRAETVLFSPAASSFDRYRNYRERGRAFKAAVAELEEA